MAELFAYLKKKLYLCSRKGLDNTKDYGYSISTKSTSWSHTNANASG